MCCGLSLESLLDISNGIAHGLDVLRLGLGDLDVKSLLKLHDELDGVK